MDWVKLLNEYGFPATLFLLLVSHAKSILAFVERSLSKIWPSFAEQRRLKLKRAMAADERAAEQQRLKQESIAAAKREIDTVLALKEIGRFKPGETAAGKSHLRAGGIVSPARRADD